MIRVVWPEGIKLSNWAACLVYDFAEEGLPKLDDEKQWAEWGTIVANTGIFLRAAVPPPVIVKSGERVQIYNEWTKWAKQVYTIMSDEYSIPKVSTI